LTQLLLKFRRCTDLYLSKGIIQPPAKQAERVLAPGDGEAEPGVLKPHTSQPTKWATDETCKNLPTTIFRQLRRLCEIDGRYPRPGFVTAWS
jgi:hypothetical protein